MAGVLCSTAAALAILLPTTSAAEERQFPRCWPRQELADRLYQSYNEESIARGVSVDGNLVEVFVGPQATFTIAKVTPRGYACIVEIGEGWRMRPDGADRGAVDQGAQVGRLPQYRLIRAAP